MSPYLIAGLAALAMVIAKVLVFRWLMTRADSQAAVEPQPGADRTAPPPDAGR